MRGVLASVTAVLVAVAPLLARADTRAVAYTYEVENLQAYPDRVFVAWPRTCGSTGAPLGAVSLELNPDWVSRLHDVDYEVLEAGKHHEVLPYCAQTTRIFALPAAAFPRATREATADDSSLGKKPGEKYAVLPALDAIDLQKRLPFFASDPRRVPSAFRFDVVERARAGSPLKAVHDVLAIEGVFGSSAAATFAVAHKRAVYTYDDGTSEALPYQGAQRPSPTRAGALDVDAGVPRPSPPGVGVLDAGGSAPADPSADADAGASAAPTPAPPPRRDLGTRWVYAAAIGGLLAGAALARFRKKRTPPPR